MMLPTPEQIQQVWDRAGHHGIMYGPHEYLIPAEHVVAFIKALAEIDVTVWVACFWHVWSQDASKLVEEPSPLEVSRRLAESEVTPQTAARTMIDAIKDDWPSRIVMDYVNVYPRCKPWPDDWFRSYFPDEIGYEITRPL